MPGRERESTIYNNHNREQSGEPDRESSNRDMWIPRPWILGARWREHLQVVDRCYLQLDGLTMREDLNHNNLNYNSNNLNNTYNLSRDTRCNMASPSSTRRRTSM